MLTEHVPSFAQYKCLVKEHIQQKHYEDMCKPSVVVSMQVPLGITMKNENKIDEMVQILSSLHKYVPSTRETLEVEVEGEEEPDQLTVNHFHSILFGGDR